MNPVRYIHAVKYLGVREDVAFWWLSKAQFFAACRYLAEVAL